MVSFTISTEANRGNVAIIAWNTLGAKVWGVDSTKGTEVTKGQVSDTLLATHFRNFVYETKNNADDKWFKEAEEVTVEDVPATDKALGERQIVLTYVDDANNDEQAWKTFYKSFKTKSDEEATYAKEAIKVVAYVPETVCADLDTLRGREITVLFGKNNVVALIMITNDDTVNDQFVDEYNFAKDKITIAGETYKFANTAKVFVNNIEMTDPSTPAHKTTLGDGTAAGILKVLEEKTEKDFNKKVEANVILNSDGDITRLDLYVSGNFNEFFTKEDIVKKVKKEKITCLNDVTFDYSEDYLDDNNIKEDDLPRVFLNGEKATLADIDVGDVLTVYYGKTATMASVDQDDIVTINVTRKTVAGEVTKVRNSCELTIDGTVYVPTKRDNLLVSTDEVEDAKKDADSSVKDLYEEDVELALNMYGEYILITTDATTADYQFAMVQHVYEVEEDDEDKDVRYQKVRLFLADGSVSRAYKLFYDHGDVKTALKLTTVPAEGNSTETLLKGKSLANLEGALVAFSADSNNYINVEDIVLVNTKADGLTSPTVVGGYKYVEVVSTDEVDYDRKRIEKDDFYKVNDATVIFNNATTLEDMEKMTWKDLVGKDAETMGRAALLIFDENNEDEVAYIYVVGAETATDSAVYGVLLNTDYTGKVDGDEYDNIAEIYTENGETKEYGAEGLTLDENTLVAFETKGTKLDGAPVELIDIDKIKDLADSTAIDGINLAAAAKYMNTTSDIVTEMNGCTTCHAAKDAKHLAGCAAASVAKEAFEIRKIEDDVLLYVNATDLTDATGKVLNMIKVDTDEVVVIDVSGKTPTVVNFSEVDAGDFVVAFNPNRDGEARLLVIIK